MSKNKFRGKRCSDGSWVYGSYLESNLSWHGHKPHKSWIVGAAFSNGGWLALMGRTAVKEETIGQFTGLHDKNGKEIYEGDIVSYIITTGGIASEKIPASVAHLVHYDNKHATFKIGYHSANYGTMKEVVDAGNLVVIGNIHDNPELLKQ